MTSTSPGTVVGLAQGRCCLRLQDLPKEEKIKVDEVQVTPVTQHVTAFRAICTQRLKFEIEYGLKRGTTDNCYLIQVCTPQMSWAQLCAIQGCQYLTMCCRRMEQWFWLMSLNQHSQMISVRLVATCMTMLSLTCIHCMHADQCDAMCSVVT